MKRDESIFFRYMLMNVYSCKVISKNNISRWYTDFYSKLIVYTHIPKNSSITYRKNSLLQPALVCDPQLELNLQFTKELTKLKNFSKIDKL